MEDFIKTVFEFITYFGIILALLAGLGKIIKRYLVGEANTSSEVNPVPYSEAEPGPETTPPYSFTEEEEAHYPEIEDDIRLLGIPEEEVEQERTQMHRIAPPTSVAQTPVTKIEPENLSQRILKDLYQSDSLQKAFVLSEILRPKHEYRS